MQFIYVKSVVNNDETTTKDLRTFDTFDEALATYHYQLGACINKCKECLFCLIDGDGNLRKVEKWVAPVVEEPETVEEPVEEVTEEVTE